MTKNIFNRFIAIMVIAILALTAAACGCGTGATEEADNTETELSTSDIEAALEDTKEDTEEFEESEEVRSLAVDDVDVKENKDGSVTVTVKDKNGTSETVTYEDKKSYEKAVKDGSVPETGDVVTVTSSSTETKVEVTRTAENGKSETVKVAESTKPANSSTKDSTAAATTKAQETTAAAATTKATEKETKPSSSTTPSTAAPTTAAPTTAAPTTAAHEHTWTEITQVVHHDPVYTTVTIPEQGHWQENTVTVLVEEEWDEYVTESHMFCRTCKIDLTAAGFTTQQQINQHLDENNHTGYFSDGVNILVAHHDPVYEEQVVRTWVVDVPARTEQQLVSAAYDETVVTGYRCNVCGATK